MERGLAQSCSELLASPDAKRVLPEIPRALSLTPSLFLSMSVSLYHSKRNINICSPKDISRFFCSVPIHSSKNWMFSKSPALTGWGTVGHIDQEMQLAEGLDHHQVL